MEKIEDLVVRSFSRALLNLAAFPKDNSFFNVAYLKNQSDVVLVTFTDKNEKILSCRCYYPVDWIGESIGEEDLGKTIRDILVKFSICSKPIPVSTLEFWTEIPKINLLVAMKVNPYGEKETDLLLNEIRDALLKELETKVL